MQAKKVSFSQLMTYIRCPEHYLFSYVLGIKRQPRKVFKRGFALHETLEYHFQQKKIDGKGISVLEAKEFFVHSFQEALEDYKQELAEARPCERWYRREQEAYALQKVFLMLAGSQIRVAYSAGSTCEQDG